MLSRLPQRGPFGHILGDVAHTGQQYMPYGLKAKGPGANSGRPPFQHLKVLYARCICFADPLGKAKPLFYLKGPFGASHNVGKR